MPTKKAIDQKDAKEQNHSTTDKGSLTASQSYFDEDQAFVELARAARLERMANELLIEARGIRSLYVRPRPPKRHQSMKELAKSIERSRGDGTSKP
nr:hypothetical protein [uncultured Desulfobulbus sp.]